MLWCYHGKSWSGIGHCKFISGAQPNLGASTACSESYCGMSLSDMGHGKYISGAQSDLGIRAAAGECYYSPSLSGIDRGKSPPGCSPTSAQAPPAVSAATARA